MLSEKVIKENWFPDHKAELITTHDDIQVLDWVKPGTSSYRIKYMINYMGRLIVTGDCYDAIYNWGNKIDLKFLSGLDIEYFASKCTSSRHGRTGHTWCSDVARNRWDEEVFNAFKNMSHNKQIKIESEYKDIIECSYDYMSSAIEWFGFIVTNDEMLTHLFGDDYWSVIDNIGRSISTDVQGHLIGIKMAYKQLKESYKGTL